MNATPTNTSTGSLTLLFEVIFYPLVMGGALAAGVWLVPLEIDALVPWYTGAIVYGAAMVCAILERVHPLFPAWNRGRGDILTDLFHALFSGVATEELTKLALLGFAYATADSLSDALGLVLWPRSWPLVAQVLLFLLIAEFCQYWIHRLAHEWDFFWRFHSVHHSPLRLYWLNAARFHPAEIALSYVLMTLPPVLLGAEPIVLALALIATTVHGFTQHCNVRMRMGPLNYLVSSAPLHRWHHSSNVEEANHNYGATLIFWDLVFGTWFLPEDREPPEQIGVEDFHQYFPSGYLGQVAVPFRWRWLHQRNAPKPEPTATH